MNLPAAQEKIRKYQKSRSAPGGFLKAVLTNNLTGAVLAADPESLQILPDIVRFVWHEVPANIWGSEEKVQNHLNPVG